MCIDIFYTYYIYKTRLILFTKFIGNVLVLRFVISRKQGFADNKKQKEVQNPQKTRLLYK